MTEIMKILKSRTMWKHGILNHVMFESWNEQNSGSETHAT